MYYHPALDGAPSSVSSTLVAIVSSVTSILGCVFMLLRLRRIKITKGRRWHTRHYLIFVMATANLAMSLTALISGGFFLVYGRIASAAGCTISGMIELWAQQAVDICSVLTTVAALASLRHNTQWTQKRYWIQTNMAPVFGIIVFLPLVNTIITQIVWRFRSSEFAYCWIPRMPVHARWIAVDGWRVLAVGGILCVNAYMGFTILAAKRRRQRDERRRMSLPANNSYSSSTCSVRDAKRVANMHLSEIDSGPASNVSDSPRGLFSQSMHNIQYWALSKLGRSHGDTTGVRGMRSKAEPISDRPRRGLRATLEPAILSDLILSEPTANNDSTNALHDSTTRATPRSYYEQFMRSLGTLVRWFHITTDIPSPTLSPTIFDSIGKQDQYYPNRPRTTALVSTSTNTRCDLCSHCTVAASQCEMLTIGSTESYRTDDLHVDMVNYFDMPIAGLRRWCSALTRLVKKPSRVMVTHLRQSGARLRRSHTAPVMLREDMDLCNCVFKRPRDSHTCWQNEVEKRGGLGVDMNAGVKREQVIDIDSDNRSPPCEQQVPQTLTFVNPPQGRHPTSIHGSNANQNPLSIHDMHANNHASLYTNSHASSYTKQPLLNIHDPARLPSKIQEIFGHTLQHAHAVQPRRVSIYTCANHHINESPRVSFSDEDDDDESARIINIERLPSPPPPAQANGGWSAAVTQCRTMREAAIVGHKPVPRVSRLYVYPLAYALMWLPSIIYFVMSTRVYFSAFHGVSQLSKRSVDMGGLPAHWTHEDNANRAWPFLVHAAPNAESGGLYWLAIIQAVHLLNGAVDALLFWFTESQY